MRTWICTLLAVLAALEAGCSRVPAGGSSIDRDLMEITVPQLQALYRSRKYTVTEVVRWHIARVRQYNGIYGAVQNLDEQTALATVARVGTTPYIREGTEKFLAEFGPAQTA
ncbi:MAG: hypothetical protein ABSF12_14280 [Bryobacteraceae bacterium]|jgi:hypothetical protein